MGNTINIVSEVSEITVTPELVTVTVVPEEQTIVVGDGPQGPAGPGVPAGGLEGQILVKSTDTDYDTQWIDNDAYRVIERVKCGVPVTKGQAVYVTGATGANVVVGLAQANSEATSSKTLAIAAETGTTNDFIKVVLVGAVEDINTAGATAGDPVWLSPTTAGGLVFGVANKPSAPNQLVYMGVVVRAHANQGAIQVHIVNGFELEELHNVSISTPSSGQVLTYNGSLWTNAAPAGDITAVSVSSPLTGGGTSGAVSIGFDQSAQNTTNDVRYARLGATNAFTVGGHTITNAAAAVVPLTIQAVTGQTASLTEWKNSAGNVAAQITSYGAARFADLRINTTSFLGTLAVAAGSATTVGAVIRGAASQTANLTEWQNSSGTILGRVDSVGSGFFAYINSGGAVSGAQYTGQTASAATVGMRLRGIAGQTANMVEIQNSSGTILARVDSAGIVYGAQVRTTSNLALLTEASSGGSITLARPTAALSNPGANVGRIYFRDGTNAGTLKLVVLAGTAGAETTILDNIPQ